MRQGLSAFVAAAILVGCGSSRLGSPVEGLRATPTNLLFPTTFIGYPSWKALVIENTGAVAERVRIDVNQPFAADQRTLLIEAGQAQVVHVRFAPATSGHTSSTLTVTAESVPAMTVGLAGDGASPSTCKAADECHGSAFSPESGMCEQTPMSDGHPCGASNACLSDGACRSGVCVGTTRNCDDGNICTTDGCDAAQGCIHVSTTAACPQPSDPCRVATCDPASGCGVTEAPDWTPCGSMSCTEAHVCFSGACLAVTPPDGIPCGASTPCNSAPTCQAGSCVHSDGGEIPLLWSYSPPRGYSVHFPGIADAVGDVFWVEHPTSGEPDAGFATGEFDAGPNYFTSATRDGQIRFRVAQPALGPTETMALLANGVVVIGSGDRRENTTHIAGLSATDGGLLWDANLVQTLGVSSTTSQQCILINDAAYDGVSGVIVPINDLDCDYSSCPSLGAWIGTIDVNSGRLTLGGRYSPPDGSATLAHLIVRPDGTLFVTATICDPEFYYQQGAVGRFNPVTAGFSPLDAWTPPAYYPSGWVGGAVASADDLLLVMDVPPYPYSPRIVRMPDGGGAPVAAPGGYDIWNPYRPFLLRSGVGYGIVAGVDAPSEFDENAFPTSFNATSGTVRWTASRVPGVMVDGPILTNHRSLIVASQPYSSNNVPRSMLLSETLDDGGMGFACPLGAPTVADREARGVLRAERWIIGGAETENVDGGPGVAAFALPGYDTADGGWVAPGGNMQRNGYVP